ncbi:HD domain-containing protein [Bacillus sp. AK128]
MIIKDNLYGDIEIVDLDIIDIINTKIFSRLKLIKQQGNTFFLLPESTHTRFEHSLGLYHLTNLALDKMIDENKLSLSIYEQKLARFVAILHDIGHGPFSHCFKGITGQDHGDWTVKIVKESRELDLILRRTPKLFEDIISVLQRDGKFALIEEILFGSISLDQLDFWNRDLYYSRIDLKPLNLDSLLSCFIIKDNKVCITNNGIQQIEQMIRIKNALYHKGFGHPFIIGKDILLKEIFNLCLKKNIKVANNHLKNILNSDLYDVSFQDYISVTDMDIVDVIRDLSNNEEVLISDLANAYLSMDDSLDYKVLDTDQEITEKGNIIIVQEKKNYSSYVGGVFVKSDDDLFDIVDLSGYIEYMKNKRTKKIVYYINEIYPVNS